MGEFTSVLIWAVVIVASFVVESLTSQLVAIWSLPAAMVALIVSFFVDDFTVQLIVFVVSYALCLVFCRKAVRKILFKKPYEKTNTDLIIEGIAVVTKAINNIESTGEVRIQGKYWSARSVDGSVINEGTRVKVERIEGVKLICTPVIQQEQK